MLSANPFVSNPQNTHNAYASMSRAVFLLKLCQKYLTSSLEQEKEKQINEYIQQFYEFVNNHLKDLLISKQQVEEVNRYFGAIFQQSINQLDLVTLFIPGQGEIKQAFSLKEVFALVFAATMDRDAYKTQLSSSTSSASSLHSLNDESQIEKDGLDRVRTLCRTLLELSNSHDHVCHTGVRHELVGTLNGVYPGASFIESGVDEFKIAISEALSRQLTLQDPSAQFKIFCAWCKGQYENEDLIKFFADCQQTVVAPLIKFYHVQHGFNPIQTEETIKGLTSPEYCSPPIDIHRHAESIHRILTTSVQKMSAELRDQALLKAQLQLQENPSLTFDTVDPILLGLSQVEEAWQYVQKTKYMVFGDSTAQQQRDSLLRQCNDYFQVFVCTSVIASTTTTVATPAVVLTTNAPMTRDNSTQRLKSILATHNQLKTQIASVEKDEYFVTNFFANFDSTDSSAFDRARMYMRLRALKDHIIYTDRAIKDLLEAQKQQGRKAQSSSETVYIDTTPYQVNRILLHSLLVSPANWSSEFYQLFSQYFEFVKSEFNLSADDRRRSGYQYYETYLSEFEFLRVIYQRYHSVQLGDDHLPQFPSPLMLPILLNLEGLGQGDAGGEYKKIVSLLDEIQRFSDKELENCLKWMPNFGSSFNLCVAIIITVPSIPRIKSLFSSLLSEFQLKIRSQSPPFLMFILDNLSEEKLKWFLGEFLGKDFVKESIAKEPIFLHNILSHLSPENRKWFLEECLGKDFLTKLISMTPNLLIEILSWLDKENHQWFLRNYFGKDFIEYFIQNKADFIKSILIWLDKENHQWFFEEYLGVDFVKGIISKRPNCLVDIVMYLDLYKFKWFFGEYLVVDFVKGLVNRYPELLVNILDKLFFFGYQGWFFGEYLGSDFFKKCISQNPNWLINILILLPPDRYPYFIEGCLGQHSFEDFIHQKPGILSVMLHRLDKANQKWFLKKYFRQDFFKDFIVQDPHRLQFVLNLLPKEDWSKKDIEKDFFTECIIKNAKILKNILDRLPKKDLQWLLSYFQIDNYTEDSNNLSNTFLKLCSQSLFERAVDINQVIEFLKKQEKKAQLNLCQILLSSDAIILHHLFTNGDQLRIFTNWMTKNFGIEQSDLFLTQLRASKKAETAVTQFDARLRGQMQFFGPRFCSQEVRWHTNREMGLPSPMPVMFFSPA